MCAHPMREISNPGASGSLFYLSADDAFIIKTVQKKEAHFLQKLLPGYYLVRSGHCQEGGLATKQKKERGGRKRKKKREGMGMFHHC